MFRDLEKIKINGFKNRYNISKCCELSITTTNINNVISEMKLEMKENYSSGRSIESTFFKMQIMR